MLSFETRQGSAAMMRSAHTNPMEILARLVEASPRASDEILFLQWAEAMKKDDDLLLAALRHTFTNLRSALTRSAVLRERQSPEQRQVENAKIKAEVSKKVDAVKSIVLLNLLLPNGKAARYSTFADAGRAGGFWTKVSKLGKPQQIIGQVVTEEQLRALLK